MGIVSMIGCFGHYDLWDYYSNLGLPTVSLYGGRPFPGMAQVGTCDRSIGRLAAKYFINLGFRYCAFFGLPGPGFSKGRWSGYKSTLNQAGIQPIPFLHKAAYPGEVKFLTKSMPWEDNIQKWLQGLPKPVAIFCADDMRAFWLSVCCRHADLKIPDDVALLGCGDHESFCHAVLPNISSIKIPYLQEGFAAARLMNEILDGKKPRDTCILLEPEEVIGRASTDTLLTGDQSVTRAIRLIRRDATRGLSVEDVAKAANVCVPILQKRMKTVIGRTVYQEIRRVQLEEAKKLLINTDLPLEEVAEKCGFGYLNRFMREFKIKVGINPGAFRKKNRVR